MTIQEFRDSVVLAQVDKYDIAHFILNYPEFEYHLQEEQFEIPNDGYLGVFKGQDKFTIIEEGDLRLGKYEIIQYKDLIT